MLVSLECYINTQYPYRSSTQWVSWLPTTCIQYKVLSYWMNSCFEHISIKFRSKLMPMDSNTKDWVSIHMTGIWDAHTMHTVIVWPYWIHLLFYTYFIPLLTNLHQCWCQWTLTQAPNIHIHDGCPGCPHHIHSAQYDHIGYIYCFKHISIIYNWIDINIGATGRLHKHTICIHTMGVQDTHNMHMVDSIIIASIHCFEISQLFPNQFIPILVPMDSSTSTQYPYTWQASGTPTPCTW